MGFKRNGKIIHVCGSVTIWLWADLGKLKRHLIAEEVLSISGSSEKNSLPERNHAKLRGKRWHPLNSEDFRMYLAHLSLKRIYIQQAKVSEKVYTLSNPLKSIYS